MSNADQIDAILPQTQCGLCGFKGCFPYAEALAQKTAAINLCPPGGITGLMKIAQLVSEDPLPFMADMKEKAKPNLRAVIRENECIGCTKCIQACPVDAILGTGKRMHTVITDECTGCELCVAPCPVDCIDMVALPVENTEVQKSQFRERYRARENRLQREQMAQERLKQEVQKNKVIADRKSYIQEAVMRAKAKKQ